MRKRRLSPRLRFGLALAAPALLLVVGWLLVVRPQRSQASQLSGRIADLQAQIVAREALARQPAKSRGPRVADVLRLAEAMPGREDMPGIVLQLDSLAQAAGVELTSIAPGAATAGDGFEVRKLDLGLTGSFDGLSDFLRRLRELVTVTHGGDLSASGRLFSVEQVGFDEGADGFPQIDAKLTLDAYVYGTSVLPGATTTTTTTTTGSTTTTTATAGAGA